MLLLEYIPYPLLDWLRDDPAGKAEAVERQLFEIVAFLRDRELLHLDGHVANMRADGERIYLVDFGLATSPRFNLSADDVAVALDYRTDPADPRVVASDFWTDPHQCAWRLVTPTFTEFAARLHLG